MRAKYDRRVCEVVLGLGKGSLVDLVHLLRADYSVAHVMLCSVQRSALTGSIFTISVSPLRIRSYESSVLLEEDGVFYVHRAMEHKDDTHALL